jgi:hypothetical protein
MFGQSHRAKTVDNSSDSVRVDKLTKFPFADYETKELVQRVNKHWTLSIMTCSCSAFTSSLSTGFWFTGSADRARIFAAKLGYVFLDTAYLHSSKVLCFRKKRSTITSLAFLTAVTIDEIEFEVWSTALRCHCRLCLALLLMSKSCQNGTMMAPAPTKPQVLIVKWFYSK